MTVEFTQWTQRVRRRRLEGLPARWYGQIKLQQVADTLPDNAVVVVEVGPEQRQAITFE